MRWCRIQVERAEEVRLSWNDIDLTPAPATATGLGASEAPPSRCREEVDDVGEDEG